MDLNVNCFVIISSAECKPPVANRQLPAASCELHFSKRINLCMFAFIKQKNGKGNQPAKYC